MKTNVKEIRKRTELVYLVSIDFKLKEYSEIFETCENVIDPGFGIKRSSHTQLATSDF